MTVPRELKIKLVEEIERRWRSRTLPKTVIDVEPESRVNRSEMSQFAHQLGIELPINDDEYDIMIFKLYDRLRKEFPKERWEKKKNRTSATIRRRKELGL